MYNIYIRYYYVTIITLHAYTVRYTITLYCIMFFPGNVLRVRILYWENVWVIQLLCVYIMIWRSSSLYNTCILERCANHLYTTDRISGTCCMCSLVCNRWVRFSPFCRFWIAILFVIIGKVYVVTYPPVREAYLIPQYILYSNIHGDISYTGVMLGVIQNEVHLSRVVVCNLIYLRILRT